jgi:hypothetical protein
LHVAVELAGVAHAVQAVAPQLFGLVFGWQMPPQSWLPAAQTPTQEALFAMHALAHSF